MGLFLKTDDILLTPWTSHPIKERKLTSVNYDLVCGWTVFFRQVTHLIPGHLAAQPSPQRLV